MKEAPSSSLRSRSRFALALALSFSVLIPPALSPANASSPLIDLSDGLDVATELEAYSGYRVVMRDLASRTLAQPYDDAQIGSSAPYTVEGTSKASTGFRDSGLFYDFQTSEVYDDGQGEEHEGFEATAANPGTSTRAFSDTQPLENDSGWTNFRTSDRFTISSGVSFSAPTGFSNSGAVSRSGLLELDTDPSTCYDTTVGSSLRYCSVFGPELWTKPFAASAGQSLSFDYSAKSGDNFEPYAFLVKVASSDGGTSYDFGGANAPNVLSTSTFAYPDASKAAVQDTHYLMEYSRGRYLPWTTVTGDIPADGVYRFRFINGTFDGTGGYALDSTLYIDPSSFVVGLTQTLTFNPSDQVTTRNDTFSLAATSNASGANIQFSSLSTAVCTVSGSQVTVVADTSTPLECKLRASSAAVSGYGSTSVDRTITLRQGAVVPQNNSLPRISGTISAGETVTASEGSWGDGGDVITATSFQWIATASGPDTLIDGATSASLCIPSDLVGSTLKVRVTKTNGEGSTAAVSLSTATVAAGSECQTPSPPPAPAEEESTPAPTVITEPNPAPVVPRRVTPRPEPIVQRGPVLRGNVPPAPPSAPIATIGGRSTPIQTQVTSPTGFSLTAGVLNLGLQVQQDQGAVRRNNTGGTEVEVRKGSTAALTGSGLLPRSTVQVFLPLQGTNAKEIARIPVDEAGSFSGDAVFATRVNERPLPIGKQVLQVVSLDEDGQQSVVEMTVNIAQSAPAPEPDRTAGSTPTLRPGQFLATNAGEPEIVTVVPVPEDRQARVEGDGWQMAVDIPSANGAVAPSDEGGALLQLVRDETAVVSGSGFMPGTRADVWLFSEPTLLGTVDIDENGEFTGEVNIDSNVVVVGEHTLQLQGVGEDGYVRAANLGVVVNDTAAEATTEEAAGGFLWWLWLLVILVALVVWFAIWRYRRSRAA